jgi:hypothetical protein
MTNIPNDADFVVHLGDIRSGALPEEACMEKEYQNVSERCVRMERQNVLIGEAPLTNVVCVHSN